jgi:hypothetical protein
VTVNDAEPNVSAYLASLAMADAIKEGELEVSRVDAEFRASMKAEREKWEAEQLACQLAAEAQAMRFAEERAEYERRTAKERGQLESVRTEIDKRRAEVQRARQELDQARVEFKHKKAELEARVKEIDRHARDLEKEKRVLERRTRDLDRRNRELEAASAAAAAETSIAGLKARLTRPQPGPDEINRPTLPLPVVTDAHIADFDDDRQEEIPTKELAGGIESTEDIHAPWSPIEEVTPWTVPLEIGEPASAMEYESAAMPLPEHVGRGGWTVPAAIVGFVGIFVVAALVLRQHSTGRSNSPTASMLARPDTAAMPAIPARGVTVAIVDSAGGEIVPALSDSAEFTTLRDSIDQADARQAARRAKAASEAAAAEKARAVAPVVTDSNGVQWTTAPPLDSAKQALANAAKRDSTARKDSTKRDTLVKPKPDTGTSPRPPAT